MSVFVYCIFIIVFVYCILWGCLFTVFLWLCLFTVFLWVCLFTVFLWVCLFTVFLCVCLFTVFVWVCLLTVFLWVCLFIVFLWLCLFTVFLWVCLFTVFVWVYLFIVFLSLCLFTTNYLPLSFFCQSKIKENGFKLTKKRSRRYPATTITDTDYADDIAILANTPDQAETLLHGLERAAASIGLYVNAHKTEYMCYNQTGDISTLEGTPLKLVDKFTYLGSNVESTEKDIETRLTKAWTAINRLSIIWKSDLTDKMKRSFFQAAVTSILLYGCTTWTLTKRLEKKLDGNYTRMLRAILNKSWRQHPTRHQLYGHLPPITKTIQVRRTRHAGHCWRSRDELIRDVLLWTPTHGRAKAGRPARTYIQQLCEDTGYCPEDLPRAMNDREEWRERVRDIRATSAIWWWWWWWWWSFFWSHGLS